MQDEMLKAAMEKKQEAVQQYLSDRDFEEAQMLDHEFRPEWHEKMMQAQNDAAEYDAKNLKNWGKKRTQKDVGDSEAKNQKPKENQRPMENQKPMENQRPRTRRMIKVEMEMLQVEMTLRSGEKQRDKDEANRLEAEMEMLKAEMKQKDKG